MYTYVHYNLANCEDLLVIFQKDAEVLYLSGLVAALSVKSEADALLKCFQFQLPLKEETPEYMPSPLLMRCISRKHAQFHRGNKKEESLTVKYPE